MIAKKNSRYDLERKRIVLFNIGLLTAGSFTLAAFTYTSPVERERQKMEIAATNVEFQVDYKKPEPKVQQQPVRQQQQQQTSQQQVGSSSAITQQVRAVASTSTQVVSTVGTVGKPGSEFVFPAEPIGGVDAPIIEIPLIDALYIEGEGGYVGMVNYIQRTLNYPEDAMMLGEQGRVYLSFVVEKDGSISNVNIERGVSESLDREAKRIIRSFPKWKAGEDAYGKARTRVSLPINFVLE